MIIKASKTILLNLNYRKITLILFYITIFSLPWNLFKVWRVESAYVNGHFIDYLAPKIYISQLLLWLLWAWTLLSTRGQDCLRAIFPLKRFVAVATLLVTGILGWQTLFLRDISFFIWWFVLVTGPLLLGLWIWLFSHEFLGKNLYNRVLFALCTTTTFQSLLGITQYATQTSQTPYWLFGEPLFAPYRNLAISNFNHVQLALPYGTTPHPNILASWLLIGMWSTIILWYISKKRHALLVIFFFFQSLCLWLTESWTAWMSLPILLWTTWFIYSGLSDRFGFSSFKRGVLAAVLLTHSLWISLWLWLPPLAKWMPLESVSILRRSHLEEVTLRALQGHPWGINLANYFQLVFQAETSFIGSHFLQPVHHAGLFLVIYLGLWSILLFILFFIFAQKHYSMSIILFLSILPIFNLDHYLLSLISGQYVLFYICIIIVFLTNLSRHYKYK